MTQDWNTLAVLWGSRTPHLQTGTFLAPDTPHCRIPLESWWALKKNQRLPQKDGTMTSMSHDVSRRWMSFPGAFLAHLQQPKCQSWSCSAPLSQSSCREHRKSYCCSCCVDLCRIQNHREMQAMTDYWQLCAQLKDSVLHCLHPSQYSLLQIPLEQWSVQHSQCWSASFGALGSISLWGATCRPAGRRLWAPQMAFFYFSLQSEKEKVELILVPKPLHPKPKMQCCITLGSVVNSPHTDYLKINIRAQPFFPKPATVAVLSGLGSPCHMLRAENLGSLQNPFSRSRQVSITRQRMFFVDERLEIFF